MSDFKKSIIKGAIWSIIGQMAYLIITLATNIWLARILSPKEFGQVGIVMFFIMLANVLTDSGLIGALVRKKDATKQDYSTVFVTNLVLSLLCYILLVLTTGTIASFYHDDLLKPLLLVAGVVVIINSLELTQNAKMVTLMRFKEQSIYRVVAVLISSSIGIYLAYRGFGVWTLIIIQLMFASFNMILLWFFEGFFFSLHFSKRSFKELYSFGLNTTLSSLLNTAFENIYILVLAKYFSIIQTGLFYQAKKLQDIPGGVMNTVIQGVVFSSLAKLQDDKTSFIKAYDKINLYFLILLGLISAFIYLYSEPIIYILFGKKWLGAVFYMRLLTIASFFYVLEQINRVIFKVFNQTRQILILEFFKKGIQIVSILIGIYFLDLKILIIGFIITNIIGYLVNYYYSKKILETSSKQDMLTFIKIIFICLLSIIFTQLIINFFALEQIAIIYSLPSLLITYVLGVHMMKVIDLKVEIQSLSKMYKKLS